MASSKRHVMFINRFNRMLPLYAGRALQGCLKCDHSHLSDLKWRKYAKMLAIVVHENMKLADNTLNNEGSQWYKQNF